MKIDPASLSNVLHATGWNAIPLNPKLERLGFCGVYGCCFAVCGFVSHAAASEVLAEWAECQVQMAELEESRPASHQKDLYLVFVVPRIEKESQTDLLRILSDTHVCRKLCIETSGRTLEEAIRDLPFVNTATPPAQDDKEKVIPLLATLDLPSELKQDLGKRSPQVILRKLLNNKYTLLSTRK